jgi:circadian clock protein KaiB
VTVTHSPQSSAEPGRTLRVRLYVAGGAPNSVMARENLHAVLLAFPDVQPELEIVDVLRDPDRALRDGIVVTPMLVKVAPLPERRVLGNLRDRAVVVRALGLDLVPGG